MNCHAWENGWHTFYLPNNTSFETKLEPKRASYLSTSLMRNKKKEKINHEFFFKKRPTTTLCLYCNDFMEVLTNKIKVKRKCTKIGLKGDDREKSNSKIINNQKIWVYSVLKKSYKKVSLIFFLTFAHFLKCATI